MAKNAAVPRANAFQVSPALRHDVRNHLRDLIFDPQTSGGLLISVSPEAAELAASNLEGRGIPASFVGVVRPFGAKRVQIG